MDDLVNGTSDDRAVPSAQRAEAYLYCQCSFLLRNPKRRKYVSSFVVIEPGEFVASEFSLSLADNLLLRVTLPRVMRYGGKRFADLRDGDSRRPFFPPDELRAPETTRPAEITLDGDASPTNCEFDSQPNLPRSWRA